jgi:hypothetical protein
VLQAVPRVFLQTLPEQTLNRLRCRSGQTGPIGICFKDRSEEVSYGLAFECLFGTVKDSDGIGLGRFVMVGLDALAFRRKRAILFEQ